MKREPAVADPSVRRECTDKLNQQVRELRFAPTLVHVAKALACLHTSILEAANLHGIVWDNELSGATSVKKARRALIDQSVDEEILNIPLPGRRRYNSVREAILSFAKTCDAFTVDDLLRHAPDGTTRRTLSAILYKLAQQNTLIREKGTKGPKGSPAVYKLRR